VYQTNRPNVNLANGFWLTINAGNNPCHPPNIVCSPA
jgi:hypothetical protein